LRPLLTEHALEIAKRYVEGHDVEDRHDDYASANQTVQSLPVAQHDVARACCSYDPLGMKRIQGS
jgi:hypothetical protein